jgi:hypothetical protein
VTMDSNGASKHERITADQSQPRRRLLELGFLPFGRETLRRDRGHQTSGRVVRQTPETGGGSPRMNELVVGGIDIMIAALLVGATGFGFGLMAVKQLIM